jgi:hypothetical protein
MNFIRQIRIRALLIAFVAFHVAPILPLIVLSSIPFASGVAPPVSGQRVYGWRAASGGILVVLWFLALAPVGSGYFAAKLAKQQPLLHGVLIGVVGAATAVIWVHGSFVVEFVLALIIASCGIFGGWLWRNYSQRRQAGL